ncbi:MAG: type II secretion system protein GspM [Hyphomicrobium sp.]
MRFSLAKPIRQFAAVALLLAALATLWMAVLSPLSAAITGLGDEIEAKRAVLGRFLDVAPLETEAKAKASESNSVDLAALVLSGDNDALKAAGLQTALSEIIAEQGLRFRSTRALPPREQDKIRLITIEAGFEATLDQLSKILVAIDAHKPLLSVSGLRLAAAPGAAIDPASAGNVLDIQFEVTGAAGRVKG